MSLIGSGLYPGSFCEASADATLDTLSPGWRLARGVAAAFFGAPVVVLSASVSHTSWASMTARLDYFAVVDGGFTNGPADQRTAVVYPGPVETNHAVRLVLSDPDHKTLILLRCGQDGRSGYEVGIVAGDDIEGGLSGSDYYAVIRRVYEAQVIDENLASGPTYAVPAGASDTPSSGSVYADVSTRIAAGEQYTIEARVVNGVVELRINDEETPTLRHNTDVDYTSTMAADASGFAPSRAGSFEDHRSAGFVSAIADARVIAASVYSLVGTTTGQREVLVAVSAGDVSVCNDGANLIRVATGAMMPTGDVEAVAFAGTVRMLGGGRARSLDVVSLLVTNWVPAAGTLPGQTADGTCTGTLLATHGTRIAIGGVPGQESNVYESAIADADDFDDGSELPGSAYILSGVRPLKIGDAITCLQEASNSTLICGCENSIQTVIGDPALGNFDTGVLEERVGIGGPRSMVRLQDGIVVGHGEQGVVAITPTGQATNISRDVLTAILAKSTEDLDDLDVVVARDPHRYWVHVFMTPKDGSAGRHIIIDERIGGLSRGAGGFYEQSYPASMQPTCAELWNGMLLLGCLDGYIRTFDAESFSDDGLPVATRMPLGPFRGGQIRTEVSLSYLSLMLTGASEAVQVRAYAGITPEGVFDPAKRKLKLNRQIGPYRHEAIPFKVRGRTLALEIYQSSATGTFRVEEVDAKLEEHGVSTSQ